MNDKFNTFEELVARRKLLQTDIVRQKAYLRSQVIDIQDKLSPITKVLSFFGRSSNIADNRAGNLLKIGSNLGIDLLVGRKLKRAGWLARLVLPLVMKFTAHKSIDAVRR